jgi:hypothetical protein
LRTRDDSMKGILPMHASPRCTAHSKRTGAPCKAPAVTGCTVSRFHGAGGGGPKGKRTTRSNPSTVVVGVRSGKSACRKAAEPIGRVERLRADSLKPSRRHAG